MSVRNTLLYAGSGRLHIYEQVQNGNICVEEMDLGLWEQGTPTDPYTFDPILDDDALRRFAHAILQVLDDPQRRDGV